ncbi:phosphomevalonate kinase [Recurvomyces mirabilis]|uniref:Phosphomevalonate kinase n=1 Tax=Recurvomyces mirabilis TaxID=574656 RepID=A0AAE0WF81_9PEZI|nr:phosphomevalonate kinase [Recurvomyces mirabilis]KAK5160364.1 phosphomevalonate kinase [Recurvomyces mirabilis]
MVHHAPVAVSAPGKVLLAGGYLVLDREFTGLVFGLDARLHVIVQPIPTRNGVTLNEIVVQSPQFQDAVWEYGYRLTERDGGMKVTQLRVDADLKLNSNTFVETTLSYALSYMSSMAKPTITPASITILADNDYYSTPSDLANGSSTPPRFHVFGTPISKAHKTGLGSSAALVTALTAALLTYYLPKDTLDLSTELGKRHLHNLAQAAHCAAQGKVGSGFDVASAVYGSCLYRRFFPAILSNHAEPGQANFGTQIKAIVDESDEVQWDHEILKNAVKVPRGLRLVMCDVSHGSQTPGMVKQVLAWRKEKPDEANVIWGQLHKHNSGLADELKIAAECPSGEDQYSKVTEHFRSIRSLIRQMSDKSGVPIEPPEQTKLLDACEKIPGVVGGVVPGAGGYDAISVLVRDDPDSLAQLRDLLSGWRFMGGIDGEEISGRVSMLGVREEMEGVRPEKAHVYKQWLP